MPASIDVARVRRELRRYLEQETELPGIPVPEEGATYVLLPRRALSGDAYVPPTVDTAMMPGYDALMQQPYVGPELPEADHAGSRP